MFDDDGFVVSRSATFPTWKEARSWLDNERTKVSLSLGRYDYDPYRYVLRIDA
jgi:hypothetical protein